MPDELDRVIAQLMPSLMPEFQGLARRLIEAGIQYERRRVLAFLGDSVPSLSLSTSAPIVSVSRREGAAAYGAVSTPVREALRALSADTPTGVTTADIAAHFELHGGGVTERQVRAALKQLHKAGDAIRVNRGRYLSRDAASAQPSGEVPDEPPSGFSLAAE